MIKKILSNTKIQNFIKKCRTFFDHPIDNTRWWFEDTVEWIKEAFTNWDMELNEFWVQIKYMARKTPIEKNRNIHYRQ